MPRTTLSRHVAASLLALASLAANAAAQEAGRGARPGGAGPPALLWMIHPSLVSCSVPRAAAGQRADAQQRRRAPVCAPRTADCNGDPADGCEVNLNTSKDHCGRCNRACAAGQICSGSVCVAQECTPTRESCNGVDDDCDGQIDEGLGSTTCGVGACQRTVQNCVNGVPQTCSAGAPASEVCGNGSDDDCDGAVDENCTAAGCTSDSQCNDANPCTKDTCVPAPSAGPGYCKFAAAVNLACDDGDPNTTVDKCDATGNCVGQPCAPLTFYKDADNDGFGVAGSTVSACTRPTGYAATAGDCDDTKATVRPNATEVCGNSKDDDCDALVDENCP